jgi:glycosyltransferase involved in cell wall biosynthesis
MGADTEICEIRVPTFRRPKLLRRALFSIVTQTYSNWRCVVFDDCPDGSGRQVVEDLQDSRIQYCKNPKRLGANGNIDKSFVSGAIIGGKYAFVLEDDNYLLPNHIEHAIGILSKHNVKVALCNQYCETFEPDDKPGQLMTNNNALNNTLWLYNGGQFDFDGLLPILLFPQGTFSNGSAFWATDCRTDFFVGPLTKRSEIQESLRLLQLRDRVYVSLTPTSVWRGHTPQIKKRMRDGGRLCQFVSNGINFLLMEKEKIDFRSVVINRLGIHRIIAYVENHPNPDFAAAQIERSLLLCGHNIKLHRSRISRLAWVVVGRVVRSLIPNRLN